MQEAEIEFRIEMARIQVEDVRKRLDTILKPYLDMKKHVDCIIDIENKSKIDCMVDWNHILGDILHQCINNDGILNEAVLELSYLNSESQCTHAEQDEYMKVYTENKYRHHISSIVEDLKLEGISKRKDLEIRLDRIIVKIDEMKPKKKYILKTKEGYFVNIKTDSKIDMCKNIDAATKVTRKDLLQLRHIIEDELGLKVEVIKED